MFEIERQQRELDHDFDVLQYSKDESEKKRKKENFWSSRSLTARELSIKHMKNKRMEIVASNR